MTWSVKLFCKCVKINKNNSSPSESVQKIWHSQYYYDIAKNASMDEHWAIKRIKKIAGECETILEVGCGEGSKLAYIAGINKKATGLDVSPKAIKIASSQYPQYKFKQANAENLPFKDGSFDLTYSAFTLEHTDRPESVINEMFRVTKNHGYLAFVAPNYGAPFRISPCFKGNRVVRIMRGVYEDIIRYKPEVGKLNWRKVVPITDKPFHIDYDTTIEPYLRTLVNYLERKAGNMLEFSSCWNIDTGKQIGVHTLFKYFGMKNMYPFIYWGPHLYVLWQKN